MALWGWSPVIADGLAGLAVAIDGLELLEGNPRRGDIEAVARSLDLFGQRKPIVATRDGVVIAGNHTLAAARQLGWPEIAVVWVDDDEATAKAYALADNRTHDLGGYDAEALAALISEVAGYEDELLFASTGYTADDLTLLLAATTTPASVAADVDEAEAAGDVDPAVVVVTHPGDVWQLGPHRLVCGDCRDAGVVAALLEGRRVNVAFTSPPYAEQRDYDPASGFVPIPPELYVDWFAPVAANVATHLAADGSWFVNIKPAADGLDTELYVHDLVAAHARRWGWHFATEFCWERAGVPKAVRRRFKNQFEPIYQFTRGEWKVRPDNVKHVSTAAIYAQGRGSGNNGWAGRQGSGGVIDQGRRRRPHDPAKVMPGTAAKAQGTNRSSIGEGVELGFAFPGNRIPTFTGTHTATGHAAAFPVGLPAWFVRAFSDAGDVVFDPFAGSGSTILAAHAEHRVGFGVELSAAYCDLICRRWQAVTDIAPTRAGEVVDFSVAAPA